MRIAVLGAGSWGTTVASLVAPRHDTVLWARDPDVAMAVTADHSNPAYLPDVALPVELTATADLDRAVCNADLLVVGVPTSGFRAVLESAAPCMRPWVPVVSLSKGLERGTHLRMTEVIKQVAPGHPVAALTGPNISHEIISGMAAAAVIATEDMEVASAIQAVFTRGVFRVYRNDDVVGCEMGGALKNVIAIAAGVADGLGYGWNSRAALITRGLAELARLGVAIGGDPLTFLGLAGNGDLIATCCSDKSRNHRVGVALGQARSLGEILTESNMVAEGVDSTPAVLALARRVGVEMPVAEEVGAMLAGARSPKDAVDSLMGRGLTSELHDLGGRRFTPATDGPG